jgi:hypothetical protein
MFIADGSEQERAKYEEIWSFPEYKTAASPGLMNVERFMKVMNPPPLDGLSIIDIGCGSGGAGLKFQKWFGFNVHWLDLTSAGLDPDVDRERFIEAPLWSREWLSRKKIGWDYGFCCDVLEHIPTEYTMLCLDNILSACRTAWLQIALRPDEFGKMIGESLHLTVRPYDWWLVRLASIGNVIDARDLCGDGLYVVQR